MDFKLDGKYQISQVSAPYLENKYRESEFQIFQTITFHLKPNILSKISPIEILQDFGQNDKSNTVGQHLWHQNTHTKLKMVKQRKKI